LSWFDGIEKGSFVRFELNNGEVFDANFINLTNGIVSCEIDEKIKKFKENRVESLEELNFKNKQNTNSLELYLNFLSNAKELLNQKKFDDLEKYLSKKEYSEFLNKKATKEIIYNLNLANGNIVKQVLETEIDMQNYLCNKFYHLPCEEIKNIFSYIELNELKILAKDFLPKHITNKKAKKYLDILKKILQEKQINLILIISKLLINKTSESVKIEFANFFYNNKDNFILSKEIEKEYFFEILNYFGVDYYIDNNKDNFEENKIISYFKTIIDQFFHNKLSLIYKYYTEVEVEDIYNSIKDKIPLSKAEEYIVRLKYIKDIDVVFFTSKLLMLANNEKENTKKILNYLISTNSNVSSDTKIYQQYLNEAILINQKNHNYKKTNGLQIKKKSNKLNYNLNDIDTIKELNIRTTQLQTEQKFNELLAMSNELLKQDISFEFKVRLLEIKSQALNSLEELEEALKVYEELVETVKQEDINNDYKYENYLSNLIGLKIKSQPSDVARLLDKLYKENSNSKSYQHYYRICLNKGILKKAINTKQKEFIDKIESTPLTAQYQKQELISRFQEYIRDKKYEKLKKSSYRLKNDRLNFSIISGKAAPIMIYELNYQIITNDKHPNVFEDFLSEILFYNKKSYYEYYYLYPLSATNIIKNDIIFALKNEKFSLAYFGFEKFFYKRVLDDKTRYFWFLYLKYFNTTKSLSPLSSQLNKYTQMNDKHKDILYRSLTYLLDKYDISYEIKIDNINIYYIKQLYNLLRKNIEVEASYEKDLNDFEPINGYKKLLKEYRDDFNYKGAFKYIEMINEILGSSNDDVIELKNKYEKYSEKLDKLLEVIYVPRDNSHYRKAILLFYIEEDIEKTKMYLKKSLEEDILKNKEASFKIIINEFLDIDFNFAYELFQKYYSILLNKENILDSIKILNMLFDRNEYELLILSISNILKYKGIDKELILKLCVIAIESYFKLNKKTDAEKIIEFIEKSKLNGLDKESYNYYMAKYSLLISDDKKAKEYLYCNHNHNKSLELLKTIISSKDKESIQILEFENLMQNKIFKDFIYTFKYHYISKYEYYIDLKDSLIQKEQFSINNLENTVIKMQESENFEIKSKYAITAYKIATILENKNIKNKYILEKEKYFLNSIVYKIKAYNFLEEFDKAISLSLFYFLYINKDEHLLSIINIFLCSILKTQSHRINKPLKQNTKQSLIKIINTNKANDITKILLALSLNSIVKILFKQLNNKEKNKINKIVKSIYNLYDSNDFIDSFTQQLLSNTNDNIKTIRIINSYKLSENAILLNIDKFNFNFYLNDDKKLLKKYQNIIKQFVEKINIFNAFTEKQNFIKIIFNDIYELQKEVKESTSFLVYGLLNDNLRILLQKLETYEQEFIKNSLPNLNIYLPTGTQFTIYNDKLSSEATKIFIKIESIDGKLIKDFYIPRLLGDEKVSKEFIIDKQDISTIRFIISYDTITSSEEIFIEKNIKRNIENFENIDNVYRVGHEVKDKSMFIGRDEEIKKLSENIKHNRVDSIMFYGQKRAGKSSIAYHLKEQLLQNDFIAIKFSMGEINSLSELINTIALELNQYYFNTTSMSLFDKTNINMMSISTIVMLSNFIKISEKYLDNKPIVLLIDEFTSVYDGIKKGKFDERFMENWRALVDKNLFKSILIGQNTAKQFIAEYANQFSSIEKIKITYLKKEAAKELIVNPIRMIDGRSRYLEDSVELILNYSAYSPYFIQRICKEIIEILNDTKNNFITNFVVEKAIDFIVKNDNTKEGIDFFDNLYSFGHGEDKKHSYNRLNILVKIANNENVNINNNIIKELLENEIINSKYKIKVKLFEKYLQTNRDNILQIIDKNNTFKQKIIYEEEQEINTNKMVDNIVELLTIINKNCMSYQKPQYFDMYGNANITSELKTICDNGIKFTIFTSTLYKLIFEGSSDIVKNRTKNLSKLPNKFAKEHTFVQMVDTLRHHFGGHEILKDGWIDYGLSIGDVLIILKGSKKIPRNNDTKAFIGMQVKLLSLFEDYLDEIYNSFE